MRPPYELPVLWCGVFDQHPGHVWDDADGERWCPGTNADGTTPYDPARPGYEAPPAAPLGEGDPLAQLDAVAREVKAHVTIHASYGEEATRHPDPDWSCQIVWATGRPEEPTHAFFGAGTTMPHAVRHVLTQIREAIEASQEETQ